MVLLDIIFLKYTQFNNLFEFGSGSLNKFHFVVHFKSTVTLFHGNGNEVLGVKGPPTN